MSIHVMLSLRLWLVAYFLYLLTTCTRSSTSWIRISNGGLCIHVCLVSFISFHHHLLGKPLNLAIQISVGGEFPRVNYTAFCFILTFNTSYPCICALGNLSYWCFQVHSLDFSGSCVSSSKFSVNGSGYKDESFNVHNDIHLFHSVSCSISCSLYWPLVHWFGLTCCWKEAWAFGNFSELCCKFCGCLLWFTIKFSFPTLLYQFLLSFMV